MDQMFLDSNDFLQIASRLVLALLAGAAIGFNQPNNSRGCHRRWFPGGRINFAAVFAKICVVQVRGLTTAATIWVAAGLGAAIGCGLWQMGLLGTLLVLLMLGSMKQVQEQVKLRGLHHSRTETTQLSEPQPREKVSNPSD